jgi:hypothetical protein
MRRISKQLTATLVAIALPTAASAGPTSSVAGRVAAEPAERPIAAAVAKAGSRIASKQEGEGKSRGRFWTSIALIAGGGALISLSAFEFGDDETGPDDGEDIDGSDDGEDSDGWGSKAMLGGGIAAAGLGTVLLMTGAKKSGPVVSVKQGRFSVRHTVRF